MVAVQANEIMDKGIFSDILTKVFSGETYVISGAKDSEAVMLPKKTFDELHRAKANAEYQAKLDHAFAEYKNGEPGISVSWEELEAMSDE